MAKFRLSQQARDLAREIAVVVFGVLIALAAQQGVETFSWHQKANDARAALRLETEENYKLAAERIVVTPCLNAQLDRLKAFVLLARKRITPVPTTRSAIGPAVYRHPSRLWSEGSWKTTVSDQVISHLSSDERQALSDLYASLNLLRQINSEELRVHGELVTLSLPLSIDTSLRVHLLETIESERVRVESMATIAQQNLQIARYTFPGIGRVVKDPAWILDLTKPGGTSAYCRENRFPLAPIP